MRLLSEAIYLLDEKTVVVGKDNFARLVDEMRALYKQGSRQLGNAIIEASNLLEKNQYEEAKAIYQNFLSICPSLFYKDIAINELDRLDNLR